MQRAEHLLKVPRILKIHFMGLHLSLRRHRLDVAADGTSQRLLSSRIQQLIAIDQQVIVLTDGDRRTPPFPATFPPS